MVYIGQAQHRIDKNTFDALRKLLLAHPEISESEFKASLREQWAILAVDQRAAIEALPELLPTDPRARRALAELVQTAVAATSKLSADAQRRLREVLNVLTAGTAMPDKGEVAAE